jgi:twinkle protein
MDEKIEQTETTPTREDLLIRGVYDAEEFADDLWKMREKGLEPGVSTGWHKLDEFYTVKRKQWTVVTGVPGYGKSTFLDNLLLNLAKLHGWKFLYFAFETPIDRHIAGLMEIHSGKVFGKKDETKQARESFKMTDQEFNDSFQFINKHFRFVQPDEAECTVQGIMDISDEIKNTDFVFDGMVVDPWNEIEHRRPPVQTESDYISETLTKFRRFGWRQNIHFWMVAHPTKLEEVKQNFGTKATLEQKQKIIYKKPTLYSISGSAHWRNKADMGIVIHQNQEKSNEPCEIDVQKVRFKECGRKGQNYLYYDYFCSRMVQTVDELLFAKFK